jgi:hypothetical protein
MAPFTSAAEFAGGTGEPNNPYQIATAEQLISIGSDPNLLNKHFILVNDIDLDPNLPGRKVFDRAVIGSFDGVFNGNGHIISNLTITGYSYLGLFGKMSGRVLNLGIEDALIVGNGNSLYLGGLVGENSYGMIANCYVTCAVSGSEYLGGLVGGNKSGTITNCYAKGSVCGGNNSQLLGGLVGINTGNISNCYATASINAGDNAEHLDGFVGLWLWHGNITNCFYDIEASKLSKESMWWSTGLTTAEMQDPNTFLDAGWDMVGERANGTAELWQMPEAGGYPVLTVFSDTFRPRELAGVGTTEDPYRIATAEDLGAINHYDRSACYKLVADINLTNITWTTAPIVDFDGTLDGDGFTVSNLSIKGGNYLGLFSMLGPSATVKNMVIEDANIVSTPNASYLGTIAATNRGGSIENCCSTGNVSDSYSHPPYIYQSSFSIGGLVGANRGSITNCNANVQVYGYLNRGGLVGSNGGSITSCYTTADITGGHNNFSVGGLVGENNVFGSITNCYSTGAISGGSDSGEIGGLVGNNSGCIMNCYAIGSISHESGGIFLGGLVGLNSGSITNCYSTGSIFGRNYLGGLCGMNWSNGSIIKCYATGSVLGGNNSEYLGGLLGFNTKSVPERGMPGGIISSCYLLSPADGGGPDNGLGSPLTDEQMKQKSSFIDWDFENIWMICEGKDYPRLQWENVQCESE